MKNTDFSLRFIALWVTPQSSAKLNVLCRYKIVVSFISVAFVVFNKFSNIFVAMQHPWNIPFFGGFLGLFSHKCGSSLLKFRLEVVSHKTKGVFEHSFKIKSLNGNGTYPQFTILVHLWAQFTHGKPKILPKKTNLSRNYIVMTIK